VDQRSPDIPCPSNIVRVLGKRRSPRLRTLPGLTRQVFGQTDVNRRICSLPPLYYADPDVEGLAVGARPGASLIRRRLRPRPLHHRG
jgi:hypothetical protein